MTHEEYDILEGARNDIRLQVAGAYLAAAEVKTSVLVSHFSGVFNTEAPLDDATKKAIRALTPADAERSLQVYVQERVVEEANWWTLAFASLSPAAFKAAATARLNDLKLAALKQAALQPAELKK